MQGELATLSQAEPLGNTYNDLNTSNLIDGGEQKAAVSQQKPVRHQLECNPPPVLDEATRRRRHNSLGNNSIANKPAPTSARLQRRTSTGFAAPTETSVRRSSIGSDVSVGSSASVRRTVTRKPISRTSYGSGGRAGRGSASSSQERDAGGLSTAQLDAHTAKTGTSNMLEMNSATTSPRKKPKARKSGWDDDVDSIASSIQSSVRRRRVAPRPLPVNRPTEPVSTPNTTAVTGNRTVSSPTSKIPSAPSPSSPTVKRTGQATTAVRPATAANQPAATSTSAAEPGTITAITISDSDSEADPQTVTVSISPMTSGCRSAKQPLPFVQEMDEYNEPVPRKTQPTSFQSPTPPRSTALAAHGKAQKTSASAPDHGSAQPTTKSTAATTKPSLSSTDGRRGSNASDGVQFRVEDSDSDNDDDDTNASGRTPLHVLRERARGEQAMNAMREDGDQQAPVVPPLPLFELSARRGREAAAAANKNAKSTTAAVANPAATKPNTAGLGTTNHEADAAASLSGDSISVSTITVTPTPVHAASHKGTPKAGAVAVGTPAPVRPTHATTSSGKEPSAKPEKANASHTTPAAPAAAPASGSAPAKPAAEESKVGNNSPPTLAPKKDAAKCCVVM